MVSFSSVFLAAVMATVASAHIVISYPGWRGNNLVTNETFPFGMQWMYPCGGTPPTTNRTFWPTVGGALAFQPGWFQGHGTAMMYVNLGFGSDGPGGGPWNMSNPMVPVFQIIGPSKNPYPGTVCLPQIPLPSGAVVKPGDNATIQVVELAVHGASLFSCVDITFAEPQDPRIELVNETNCFNSNGIGFAEVYSITTKEPQSGPSGSAKTSDASESVTFWYFGRQQDSSSLRYLSWVLPALIGGLWLL